MQNYNYIYNRCKYDLISKYNLFSVDSLNFNLKCCAYVLVSMTDSKFLSTYSHILKLFFFWFGKKAQVLRVSQSEVSRTATTRNSLVVAIGVSFNNKREILLILSYIRNIMFPLSARIDNLLVKKKILNSYVYSFSNINYILGLPVEQFYRWSNTIYLKFDICFKNSSVNKKNFINFYEKMFF